MPQATVAAIISDPSDTSRILLTRRSVRTYQGYWCLPGGHIELNETARQAIIREAKEETGIDLKPTFFGYFDEIIPERKIHAVVLAFVSSWDGEIHPGAGEVAEYGWFSPDEALSLPLAFDHKSIIEAYFNADRHQLQNKEG